jgi:hypothetical protein
MFALLEKRKTERAICLDEFGEFTSRMSQISRLRAEAARLEKEAEVLKLEEHKRFDDKTTDMVSKFIEEQTLPFDLSSDTITFDQIKSLSTEQLEYLIFTVTKCKLDAKIQDIFGSSKYFTEFGVKKLGGDLAIPISIGGKEILIHSDSTIFSSKIIIAERWSCDGHAGYHGHAIFDSPGDYHSKLIAIIGYKFCTRCGPFSHFEYDKCMKDAYCRFCRKAKSHETLDCPAMVCTHCKTQGHTISRCKIVPTCTYCRKHGHTVSHCAELPCYTCKKSKIECRCGSTHYRKY